MRARIYTRSGFKKMEKINDGGPAFPRPIGMSKENNNSAQKGMSLRDYFAIHCLQTLLSNQNVLCLDNDKMKFLTKKAYKMADYIIEERENVETD